MKHWLKSYPFDSLRVKSKDWNINPIWRMSGTLLLVLIVILPFLLLTAYNFPSSDDYADLVFVHDYGYKHAFLKYYMEWGGRYFSVFLTFLLNMVAYDSLLPYRLISLTSLIMLVIFCWQLTQIFHRIFNFSQRSLFVFPAFLILLFGYVPSPVELLYWFTGSWVYLPGLLMIAAWVQLAIGEKPIRGWRLGVFGILPIFIAGTNEVNIILFGGLWVLIYQTQQTIRRSLFLPFFLFLAGCLIALLAPGNLVRQDFFLSKAGNPAADLSFSLKQVFWSLWHWGRDWLRSTPILIAGVILYLESTHISTSKIQWKKIAPPLLLTTVLILAIPFPFFWGTGRTQPALRILNIYWIAFAVLVLWWMIFMMQRLGGRSAKQPVIKAVLFLTLFAYFSYRSNWRQAWDDLRIAADYRDQINQRIFEAESAGIADTISFEPLRYTPNTIVYIDLNKDPGHWYNKGFANRYGVAAVRVLPDDKKQN